MPVFLDCRDRKGSYNNHVSPHSLHVFVRKARLWFNDLAWNQAVIFTFGMLGCSSGSNPRHAFYPKETIP